MEVACLVSDAAAAVRMDRMYRRQRHVYDLTRKFYLLGRDRLISRLDARPGHCILEIACGTGRNLIRAARRYPEAQFFGIDISTEMLASAAKSIARNRLDARIQVAVSDATSLHHLSILFGRAEFDRVLISYSLSMIPAWRSVLPQVHSLLARGGEFHVVDFGDFHSIPGWFRTGMRQWLSHFDVTPRDELEYELAQLARQTRAPLHVERQFRGYAQYAMIRRTS